MRPITIILFINAAICRRTNVCKELIDYYFKESNPNCWFDPDVERRSEDIIAAHGYPVEQFLVVTEDFFKLTLLRIPQRKERVKGVVLLQHPALTSSSVWLSRGNESFAFLLSDAGYDVWLGNFRGTSYSDQHVFLSKETNSFQYWNYSFHEMGVYDVPAQIQMVRNTTGYRHKLIYIGHSMGTTAALIHASLKPNEADDNVQLFMLWSPVAFLGNARSPVRVTGPFIKEIWNMLQRLQAHAISYDGIIHKLSENTSLLSPYILEMFSMFLNVIGGPPFQNGNPAALPAALYQSFEGLSAKALLHLGQLTQAKDRFQWYDYGEELNRIYYSSKRPPSYPLWKIRTPVRLVIGTADYLSDAKDAYLLYDTIQSKIKTGVVVLPGYNHFDFFYGKLTMELLYIPTLKYLEQFYTKE